MRSTALSKDYEEWRKTTRAKYAALVGRSRGSFIIAPEVAALHDSSLDALRQSAMLANWKAPTGLVVPAITLAEAVEQVADYSKLNPGAGVNDLLNELRAQAGLPVETPEKTTRRELKRADRARLAAKAVADLKAQGLIDPSRRIEFAHSDFLSLTSTPMRTPARGHSPATSPLPPGPRSASPQPAVGGTPPVSPITKAAVASPLVKAGLEPGIDDEVKADVEKQERDALMARMQILRAANDAAWYVEALPPGMSEPIRLFAASGRDAYMKLRGETKLTAQSALPEAMNISGVDPATAKLTAKSPRVNPKTGEGMYKAKDGSTYRFWSRERLLRLAKDPKSGATSKLHDMWGSQAAFNTYQQGGRTKKAGT